MGKHARQCPAAEAAPNIPRWRQKGNAIFLLVCFAATYAFLNTRVPRGRRDGLHTPPAAGVAKRPSAPLVDSATLNAGLSAWWTFDTPQKLAVFEDGSGHGRGARANNATLASTNILARDPSKAGCGHVLRLRGSHFDDHLIVAKSSGESGLDLGTSFSFACWVLQPRTGPSVTFWQTIFDNGVSGRFNPTFGLRLLGGTVAVDFHGGGVSVAHNYPGAGSNKPDASALTQVAVPAGRWTHVAFVYDGERSGNASFYINGHLAFREKLVGGMRCNRSPAWNSLCTVADPGVPKGELWIGREAPNRRGKNARAFEGFMDDVRVYGNRALSSLEVQVLHGSLERCTNATAG